MKDVELTDLIIADILKKRERELSEHQIHLEVPCYKHFIEQVDVNKDKKEPKRVIIIDI